MTPAVAQKFGYGSVQELKEKAQSTFSLVETGIVQQPSTRLLLINVRPYSLSRELSSGTDTQNLDRAHTMASCRSKTHCYFSIRGARRKLGSCPLSYPTKLPSFSPPRNMRCARLTLLPPNLDSSQTSNTWATPSPTAVYIHGLRT